MASKADIAARNERFAAALDKAYAAADAAQAGMVENMNALDCGFAWVIIHDQPFMRWCRKNISDLQTYIDDVDATDADKMRTRDMQRKYGSKNYGTGWQFWKPGSFNGQSVGIHEAGAKAFSNTLAHELQIRCEWSSRLD